MTRENRAAAPDWADDVELDEVLEGDGVEHRPAPAGGEPAAGGGQAPEHRNAGADDSGEAGEGALEADAGAEDGAGADAAGTTGVRDGAGGPEAEAAGVTASAEPASDDEMDAFFPSVARAAATGQDVGALLDADLLTTALAERDEYLEALRRLQADFENFRKRTDRQLAEVRSRASESLLERLLPVLDACDLALAHLALDEAAESAAQAEGGAAQPVEAVNGSGAEGARALGQVASLLWDILSKEGLERVDAVGVPFDPTVHDAVAHAPAGPDDDGDGAVVEQVLRAGYLLKGRVLRPAMVQVRG